ncbi:acyl-CoA N-acyltransferase [Flagelloscypha sp. PMI_526]|nr:acyl-CoA N-acyltransferase [Flagelloscypha sp. PMI_526]
MKPSQLVRTANKASSDDIAQSFSTDSFSNYHLVIALSAELSQDCKDAIFSLTETNMRASYQRSSWGWKPSVKKKELFHSKARYILVYNDPQASILLGFCGFRLDLDEDVAVTVMSYRLMYLREERGLGKALMSSLDDIGAAFSMTKVVLTVFKENAAALRFYQSIGFTLDETDPSNYDEEDDSDDEEIETWILSKPISCEWEDEPEKNCE